MKDASRDGKSSSLQAPAANHSSSWVTVDKSGPPKYILLLGPRGCGKSSLIEIAASNLKQPPPPKGLKPTTEFRIYPSCRIGGQNIKFIDSPGFNDPSEMQETLVKLINFLDSTSRHSLPLRLTGILYIHLESDDLGSQTLRKSLHMLRVLVGERYPERVTTIVKLQSQSGQLLDPEAHPRCTIMAPGSPFLSFYHGFSEPKVFVYKSDRQAIDEMLRLYTPFGPWRLYAQDKLINETWKIEDVPQYLQQEPGEVASEHPENSGQATSPPVQETPQEIEHEKPLEPPQVQPEDEGQDTDVLPISFRNDQDAGVPIAIHVEPEQQPKEDKGELTPPNKIQQSEPAYKERIRNLTAELEKTRDEYASLRSQLQVKDNIEQSKITQGFDELNRQIEDIGQLVSDYLAEDCPQIVRSIRELEPQRLQKLLDMFGHNAGKPSLVRSSGGEYPDLADFFFYAIRATLCEQLYTHLFRPFHHSLASRIHEPQNNFITEVHKHIVRQEPQPVAGRWRKDTYNSISRSSFSTGQPTVRQIVAESLHALIGIFLGCPLEGLLTQEHEQMLDKLVAQAEDWDQFVKGVVVFHGDFRPTFYANCGEFRSSYMAEFGAKPNDTNYPSVNLATVELGLVKCYAWGGGQEPEMSVVRKAMIASEKLLFR